MEDMAVAWITQEGPALHTFFELCRFKGHLAPPRHQATDVQTPVGVEVVHDPIITFHVGQGLRRPLEMRHEIGGLPGGPKGPSDVARGHGPRMEQHPRTMADVLMFTPFAPTRLGRFGLHTTFVPKLSLTYYTHNLPCVQSRLVQPAGQPAIVHHR